MLTAQVAPATRLDRAHQQGMPLQGSTDLQTAGFQLMAFAPSEACRARGAPGPKYEGSEQRDAPSSSGRLKGAEGMTTMAIGETIEVRRFIW